MQNTHHHLFSFIANRELSEIYLSVMLKSLAISLIAIFIPVFLYNDLGYPLVYILYFLIILFATFGLSTPLSAKLATKIGFKHNILISCILYIGSFLMLNSIESYPVFFYLTPIFFGLANSLYWLSFHTDFAKFSSKKIRGQQMATWQVLAGVVAVAGPFLAGLILSYFNFHILFLIGSGVLVLSVIPLFATHDQHIKSNFKISYIFQKNHYKQSLYFLACGTKYIVHGWLWPFFIFLILSEYLLFGSTISVLGLFSLASYVIIGRLSDHKKAMKLIRIGAIIQAIASFFMGFARSIVHVFMIALGNRFSINLIDLPLMRKAYEDSKKSNVIEYIAFREIMINAGRVIFLAIFILLLHLNIAQNIAFTAMFILSGLTSVAYFVKDR